jgi:hypothetical protein
MTVFSDDDPDPVVGVILGANGEVLVEVREPRRQMGLRPPS